MTKLNYLYYVIDKDLDFEEQYYNDLKNITKFEKPNECIESRFERYKKNDKTFKNVFKDFTLRQIILAKNDVLKEIVEKLDSRIKKLPDKKRTELTTKIENLFKYTNKFQGKVLTPFFTNNFNFKTCFYCNKDFIINFEKEKKELVSTFQLDHFYDKGTYRYLALSFYNLIPSCTTCNSSKVKGSKNIYEYDSKVGKFENETCIPPNTDSFHFDKKVKFKLHLSHKCKDLNIKSKDDIDIPLKERYSNDYDKYIEVFKLNERYQAHKDIVFDMIKNAELYPESRLKELQDLTGIPYQEIKKDIFKLIDDDADLSKEPFSKLRKDMADELGIERIGR